MLGALPAVELVTVGQRRGLGHLGTVGGSRRYVVEVDARTATVTVGGLEDLMVDSIDVTNMSWVSEPPVSLEPLAVQMSAHGQPVDAVWRAPGTVDVRRPVRRVAPGQSVVLYRDDAVVGGGIAV